MEIVGTSRVLLVCILAMVYTIATCEPTLDHVPAMKNEAIDPCDDFYDHVCSRWTPPTEFPTASDVFDVIKKKTSLQLKNLVEEWSTNNETTSSEIERKLSKYYKSCLNNAIGINDSSLEMLLSVVTDNGGWPLILPSEGWSIGNQNLTLQTIHENYAEMVYNASIFDIHTRTDIDNGVSVVIPTITFGNFPAERKNENRSETILSLAKDLAELSSIRYNLTDMEQQIEELLAFEKSLFALDRPIVRGSSFTMAEMQKTWQRQFTQSSPYWINWTDVIKRTFAKANVTISDEQKIFVQPTELLEILGDLLKNHTLRTVVNYVHWSALAQLAPYASKRMASYITDPEQSDEDRSCLNSSPMKSHAMYYLYVKKYFKDFGRTRTVVDHKINDIRNAIERKISQSWMDDEAKSRLRVHINNTVTSIGYPNWYDDPQIMDEYTNDLTIGEWYLKNVINYTRFRKRRQLLAVVKPHDRYEWILPMAPLRPVPFYRSFSNSMFIPVVTLQKPYLDVESPRDSFGIDYLIGHEFGHAIGLHDFAVILCNDMDRPSDVTELCTRIHCFIDQYSSHVVSTNSSKTTVPIDGMTTLSENFADNIGLGLAWSAYPDKRTNATRFFYSIVESMCKSKNSHTTNDHRYSPMKVRMNVLMMNTREFSTAFDCPVGSPMNPRARCDFWSRT